MNDLATMWWNEVAVSCGRIQTHEELDQDVLILFLMLLS